MAIELAALTDFQRVTATSGTAEQRTLLLEIGGAVCTVLPSEPDSLLGNRVVGLDAQATDVVLDAIEDFYASHRAAFVVAGELPQLAARGYRSDAAWIRLVRDTQPTAVPAGVDAVEPVRPNEADAFGDACARFSSAPPFFAGWAAALVARSGWHCFAARDGDAIVATAALYTAGKAGWLGFAATDPSHRRRGLQTALLAARIDRGHDLGLETLVTSTVEAAEAAVSQSQRNMLRVGFQVEGTLPHWRSPAALGGSRPAAFADVT